MRNAIRHVSCVSRNRLDTGVFSAAAGHNARLLACKSTITGMESMRTSSLAVGCSLLPPRSSPAQPPPRTRCASASSTTTTPAPTPVKPSRSRRPRAPISPAGRSCCTTAAAAPSYDTDPLPGVVPATCGARGVVVLNYPTNGIQNGAPDGIALVDNTGAVVEFLSYEGAFAADQRSGGQDSRPPTSASAKRH